MSSEPLLSLRQADALLPEESGITPLADTRKSNHMLVLDASQTFNAWPDSIRAADGSGIDLKVQDGGSLSGRIWHLIREHSTDSIQPHKIAWLPRVIETIRYAQIRLDDSRDKSRIFVRKYEGRIYHAVVVRPDGFVADQQAFDGHLETQFPILDITDPLTRQKHLRIDWVRNDLNDLGLRQNAPEPTPPASTVTGPRQEEFQKQPNSPPTENQPFFDPPLSKTNKIKKGVRL